MWVEWHNAYLNRVDRMPSLTELIKPRAPDPEDEAEEAQPGLDPVGRELMNALLANFKPRFEETPKKE